MTQPLFDIPPKLTERQQAAYDYLDTDGATARDVGLHLHQLAGCQWCRLAGPDGCAYVGAAGQEVLRALRKKGLVVRRQKTGLWQRVGEKKPDGHSDTVDAEWNTFPPGF